MSCTCARRQCERHRGTLLLWGPPLALWGPPLVEEFASQVALAQCFVNDRVHVKHHMAIRGDRVFRLELTFSQLHDCTSPRHWLGRKHPPLRMRIQYTSRRLARARPAGRCRAAVARLVRLRLVRHGGRSSVRRLRVARSTRAVHTYMYAPRPPGDPRNACPTFGGGRRVRPAAGLALRLSYPGLRIRCGVNRPL